MAAPEWLRAMAPQWPITFWDLADHSTEELLNDDRKWFQALAVVRAEKEETETFQRVFREVLCRLESLASTQRMRWHDLMHFVLSWAFQRRPQEELSELRQTAAESYQDRQRRIEVL